MNGWLQRGIERWGWRVLALLLIAASFFLVLLLGLIAARALNGHGVVPAVAFLAAAVFGVKLALALRLVSTLLVARRRLEAEVEHRLAAERELHALAQRDEVTKLANRRSVSETGARIIAQAQRHDRSVAVMMLDLDGFKKINDLHGHLVGDQVLEGFARRLEGALRGADIVARFGGDEFVVLMPDTDQAGALAAAQRVQHAIRQAPKLCGVTVSIGVAVARGAAANLEQLLSRADEMLLQAKRLGRDRVAMAGEGIG